MWATFEAQINRVIWALATVDDHETPTRPHTVTFDMPQVLSGMGNGFFQSMAAWRRHAGYR